MPLEKNNLNDDQTTLSAIHLLSLLNDPRLSLEDFENKFLEGLNKIFHSDYALLLLIDANGDARVQRKIFKRDASSLVIDEVEFTAGLLYESYEKLKFMQFQAGDNFLLNPQVDALKEVEVSSLVCMPLVYQTQLFGMLAIGNSADVPFTETKQIIFDHLVHSLAEHIHSVKLILELEESNSALSTSQQQLLNSRNTLRTLFDNIPESFYVVDEVYTLIAINQSRAERLGKLPQDLVGKKCYEGLFSLNNPCPGCLVARSMENNTVEIRRMHYLQKDKTNLEWEIHTYPVPADEGKPHQVILLEQNITEKRKLEAELIQSEKLAAVGQLAAGIAHDINNPLTSIIANAQILLEDLPKDQTELLQSARLIELAGTKATQVVKNLLSSARKVEFEFIPIDLNESIQSALMLLSHEFISRNINICFNRGQNMPLIMASGNHLQSVWMNLIMNSIEAIGDAPGKIDINSQFDGDSFIVRVQDNGAGIPDEYVGQIFEPFFTTKHTEAGTGLGLTSVRRIVQAHNGQIMVESEDGQGSTFTIVLPKGQNESEFTDNEVR